MFLNFDWAKHNFNNCLKQNQTSSKLFWFFKKLWQWEYTRYIIELKKWKIHEQPSVHCNVLHCWYEYEIRYIISFQFQVKSASEEDALLKLCVIVCTILKKNMQVGCHISVVLKDQLILKIVYGKNLSLICRIFSAVLLKNYLASLFISVYMKVWLFHETLQPKYGNLFGRFLFKIVDTQAS